MDPLAPIRGEFAQKVRALAEVRSDALARAFAAVPREDFVGPGPWQVLRLPEVTRYETTPDADPRHLYENVLVALDARRNLNNGEPAALARWLDRLDLTPGARFLHIGCGAGYYTAIAAECVGGAGAVVGVELDPALAVALPMPEVGAGHMLRVERGARGYGARFISPVGIFHCAGARTRAGSDFLRRAYSQGDPREVASLRRDPHRADEQCWLHAEHFCLSRLAAEEGF